MLNVQKCKIKCFIDVILKLKLANTMLKCFSVILRNNEIAKRKCTFRANKYKDMMSINRVQKVTFQLF